MKINAFSLLSPGDEKEAKYHSYDKDAKATDHLGFEQEKTYSNIKKCLIPN